jgi:chromate transporter
VTAAGRAPAPALRELGGYFLRLGATGFGGPAALAEAMRRELVDARGWLTAEEYEDGLALAAACPGPLAYQLGVYCGYARLGLRGALMVAVCFAALPFLFVTGLASAYVRLASSGALRAVFAGVAPVVVAVIARSCWRLSAKTLGRDRLALAAAVAAGLVTVILERELALLVVLAGLLGAALAGGAPRRPPAAPAPTRPPSAPEWERRPRCLALAPVALAGLAQPATLFLFFFKTGCLIFGSGLVIVPFLKAYVVDEYRWLSDREFLDAVAVGLLTPGPVVITATFVGYLVAGLAGSVAATAGIFTPAVAFTLLAAPLLRRHGAHPRLRGFVRGVSAAVTGVLAGTALLVARQALTDAASAALAAGCLVVLWARPSLPEPALVACGAGLGLLAHAAG